MPLKFDITLTAEDMYRFNMYQTYSGFTGGFHCVFHPDFCGGRSDLREDRGGIHRIIYCIWHRISGLSSGESVPKVEAHTGNVRGAAGNAAL